MYMMVEMTAGTLPWRALNAKPAVRDSKEHSRTVAGKAQLFAGCPRQFGDILDYCDVLTVSTVLLDDWVTVCLTVHESTGLRVDLQ